MPWTYDYDNDTGPRDEGFWEWYNIFRDGETVGRMKDEKLAAAVCSAMNTVPELLAAAEELKAAFMDGCGDATKGPKRARLVAAGAALEAAIARAKGATP